MRPKIRDIDNRLITSDDYLYVNMRIKEPEAIAQKRHEYLEKILSSEKRKKQEISHCFGCVILDLRKGGDYVMKNLGTATTNVFLAFLLILDLVLLLAVYRLGLQIQTQVKPVVYTKLEKVVVTPTTLPTATPSAFLKSLRK